MLYRLTKNGDARIVYGTDYISLRFPDWMTNLRLTENEQEIRSGAGEDTFDGVSLEIDNEDHTLTITFKNAIDEEDRTDINGKVGLTFDLSKTSLTETAQEILLTLQSRDGEQNMCRILLPGLLDTTPETEPGTNSVNLASDTDPEISSGGGTDTNSEASSGNGTDTDSEASSGNGTDTDSKASSGNGTDTNSEASSGNGTDTDSETSSGNGTDTDSEASSGSGNNTEPDSTAKSENITINETAEYSLRHIFYDGTGKHDLITSPENDMEIQYYDDTAETWITLSTENMAQFGLNEMPVITGSTSGTQNVYSATLPVSISTTTASGSEEKR